MMLSMVAAVMKIMISIWRPRHLKSSASLWGTLRQLTQHLPPNMGPGNKEALGDARKKQIFIIERPAGMQILGVPSGC